MEFDVIIRNGTVVDGTGEKARRADVAISGDRISAIGDLSGATAASDIDASGRVVSPGFIDVHIHSEVELADPNATRRYGSVLQGVTTHLTAPDGFGWAPLEHDDAKQLWETTKFSHGNADLSLDWPTVESFLEIFDGTSPVNIVTQVPHCAVRFGAMGWAPRPATDDELDVMRKLTREWLEAGAVALCLGLDYQPSAFSDTRELVELSKVAAEYDAIYSAHIRNNDFGRPKAWRETMEISERAGIPVHISHEHVTEVTKPLLQEAAERCDLTFESYMYNGSCTHLALMMPVWAQAGGPEGIREMLKDSVKREQVRDYLEAKLDNGSGDWAVFAHTQTGRYVGKSIQELAADAGVSVGEFAVQTVGEELPYALMVYRRGTPPDEWEQIVRDTISHPAMMVASDGIYNGDFAHPRGFGCFAQALRLGVREYGAVSIEEAVRKMSGFPAERFRIQDRGLLKEGYGADVVIFDPETVADRATWEEPRLEPVGVDRVIVNGQTVAQDGVPSTALPGRVLKR